MKIGDQLANLNTDGFKSLKFKCVVFAMGKRTFYIQDRQKDGELCFRELVLKLNGNLTSDPAVLSKLKQIKQIGEIALKQKNVLIRVFHAVRSYFGMIFHWNDQATVDGILAKTGQGGEPEGPEADQKPPEDINPGGTDESHPPRDRQSCIDEIEPIEAFRRANRVDFDLSKLKVSGRLLDNEETEWTKKLQEALNDRNTSKGVSTKASLKALSILNALKEAKLIYDFQTIQNSKRIVIWAKETDKIYFDLSKLKVSGRLLDKAETEWTKKLQEVLNNRNKPGGVSIEASLKALSILNALKKAKLIHGFQTTQNDKRIVIWARETDKI